MRTVVETLAFQKQADLVWNDDDEVVLLLMVYAKAERETVTAKEIMHTRRKS